MILSGPVIVQKVLINGVEVDDMVSCELPNIEYMTAEMKGAGIAGTSDEPMQGLTNALNFKIATRSVNKNAHLLMTSGELKIELRVGHNENDKYVFIKVFMTAKCKNYSPGKSENANHMESSAEYNVTRYRQVADGVETLLIDKYAFIHKINGVDVLEKLRAGLN